MRGYDLRRTGANLAETALTPATVSPGTFGKLYCRAVDEEIYGQILYVPGLDFGARGRRNAVVVVTMMNSVYAFDADDGQAPALWEAHYSDAARGITPVPARDLGKPCIVWSGGYKDISRWVGILSTPAIDPATGTMYLVARTKEGTPATYRQRLHAISLLDGSERPGSPVEIRVSTRGTGAGSVGGVITFDARLQNQRAGLLLHQGVVYIAWASHCDEEPYHGWIVGYDARTLAQVVVYNNTPGGKNGGIWMAGQAPSVDEDGNLYLITGNGSADLQGGPNRGESFIKLRRQGDTLALVDWFTPFNYAALEQEDRDLGSSGALLLPGRNIVLGGGKEGKLYLLDRNNLGKHRPTDDGQALQTIAVTGAGKAHIHGTPVTWKSTDGEFVYVMAEEDYLKQFRLEGGKLVLHRMSLVRAPREPNPSAGYTMPGGVLAVSASGDRPGSGIVWASVTVSKDAIHAVVPGMLRAFDASDVSKELWHSEQNAARDSLGNFAKFNPPTVSNGRVYMPTFSKQYCVYGRLP
jgi:hypothetical protein